MDLSASHRLLPRVALLVDGDNFPRSGLPDVEAKAAHLGEITIRRVFGDMALHKDWAQETAVIATHCGTLAGKNRADIALVIAAMDFVHRGLVSAVVIVSDDRDFDPLVLHLREQGYHAERIGKPKPVAPATPEPTHKSKSKVGKDALVKKVRGVIAGSGATGYPIQSLGVALQQMGVAIADTPHKSWRAWLLSYPDEFDCDPRGPKARVRIKT